jgi:hypothetical protein
MGHATFKKEDLARDLEDGYNPGNLQVTFAAKSDLRLRELLAVCFVILSAGELVPGQRKRDLPLPRRFGQSKHEKQLPPRWDSPPEVTILKHRFGVSKKFVSQTNPHPTNPSGEPSSRLGTNVNPAVYLELKNQTTKKIIGMIWYFVLHKSDNEEYFRVRFVDTSVIEAGKTKKLTGEMDRIPRPPQTVSVDELSKPRPQAQERIVISCIMFDDGSFSSLNQFTKEDCESLKPTQTNKTKSTTSTPSDKRRPSTFTSKSKVVTLSWQVAAKVTAR